MILNKPVIINNNAKPGKNTTPDTITVSEVNVILIDNSKKKRVSAQLIPFLDTITLWENEQYDAIGEYTQAQAESRILEILGDDPGSVLKFYRFK